MLELRMPTRCSSSPLVERRPAKPDLAALDALLELEFALAHRMPERRDRATAVGRRSTGVEPTITTTADAITEQGDEMIKIVVVKLLE